MLEELKTLLAQRDALLHIVSLINKEIHDLNNRTGSAGYLVEDDPTDHSRDGTDYDSPENKKPKVVVRKLDAIL